MQDLLEWAFRVERVQLELPDPRHHDDRGFGFGLEYVLMQRAMLGCRVDGGGSNDPHEDAEVVAAAVASIPDDLGGLRMAIRVAELARAGLTPDWMPGAVPRCVPVEWRQTKHGQRGQSAVCGHERVFSRGRWRTVELRWCPVRLDPDPRLIEAHRAVYDRWREALTHIRDALEDGKMLRQHVLEERLPLARPWERKRKQDLVVNDGNATKYEFV